jgi:hypothetical protein
VVQIDYPVLLLACCKQEGCGHVDLIAGESKLRVRFDESREMQGCESTHQANLSTAAGWQHTLLIDLQYFAETHRNHSNFARRDVSLGD